MAELHINGWITEDEDGIIALSENDPSESEYSWDRYGESIIRKIENFADDYGICGEHHKGLGGRKSYIDDCNLKIYFTDKECEIEEAMLALHVFMYGGDIKTRIDRCGYSEYTITGLNLSEFSIGGHDLNSELRSHYGEYCHIIIEC